MIIYLDGPKNKMFFLEQVKSVMEILYSAQEDGLCTVFFEISGHVQMMSVRIHYPKWIAGKDPDYKDHVYLNSEDSLEYVEDFKRKIIDYLSWIRKGEPIYETIKQQ